jgi:acyl-CoA reductase-like NAD-dependent aldehyde dehydrogenase
MSKPGVKKGVAAAQGAAHLKIFIGCRRCSGANGRDVFAPKPGEWVACASESNFQDLDGALSAAIAANPKAAAMPGYECAAPLRKVAALLAERAGGIAELMSRETGKAMRDSRAEMIRSHDTILLPAEAAILIASETEKWERVVKAKMQVAWSGRLTQRNPGMTGDRPEPKRD